MTGEQIEIAISFTRNGWADFEFWLDNDRVISKRLRALIKEVRRTPYEGTGKPEPLRYRIGGNIWSRRITKEHRLVYRIQDDTIVIISARYHYEK